MAYVSSMINDSATRVFSLGAEITDGAFKAISLSGTGAVLAGADTVPIGIITAEYDGVLSTGEDVTCQVVGGALWTVGEPVKAGDLLSAGAGGKAYKATSGQYIFARALKSASTGAAAQVQIINGGYAK